jgi:hypothetical protein
MRSRGQGLLSAIVVTIVLVGGIAFDRAVPRERSAAGGGSAPSGSWICPHGGGDGWQATVFLANPSPEPAIAHVTSLALEGSSPPLVVDVPPTSTVRVQVEVIARGSSTFVETFGPWIAAGWVVRGSGEERGMGAEPCAPGGARSWYVADGSTEEGEHAFVVVANPYAANAVVDVVLFAAGRAPVRDSDITSITVPARGSVDVNMGRFAAGEPAIGAVVQARIGRVGVGGLGVGASGIRSTIGQTALTSRVILPIASALGESSVEVFGPGEEAVAFGATYRSESEPKLLPGLEEVEQDAQAAASYAVLTEGPSAVDLAVHNEQRVAAALSAAGTQGDAAATAGSPAGAAEWVVLPPSDADVATSTIVLANPGTEDAVVTLEVLPPGGGAAVSDTVTIPGGMVAQWAPDLLGSAAGAAVLVRCEAGLVVALGAAASGGGPDEPAGYALSMGVRIPA